MADQQILPGSRLGKYRAGFDFCLARGVYQPRRNAEVMQQLCLGAGLGDVQEEAWLRLELACACLGEVLPAVAGRSWPHLFAYASALLQQAEEVAEGNAEQSAKLVAALAAELVAALDALEETLAGAPAEAAGLAAAESAELPREETECESF